MRLVAIVSIFIASGALAQSRSELEKEVAVLKQQVVAKEATVDTLSTTWQTPHSIDISFSAAPLTALINDFNTLTPPQRAIEGSVFDSNGQLWGWDADCVAFGHKYSEEGAYVEFKDPNYRVQARVGLSNLNASWVPAQGLTLALDAVGHVEVGMLHWHRKPCIGGGVGGDAGPFTCDATAHLNAATTVSMGANHTLSYSASINLSGINYTCDVNLGSLGTLTIGSLVPPPAPVAFNGSMPLPVSTSGALESHDPRLPLRKEYEIALANPLFHPSATGLDIGFDVSILWK